MLERARTRKKLAQGFGRSDSPEEMRCFVKQVFSSWKAGKKVEREGDGKIGYVDFREVCTCVGPGLEFVRCAMDVQGACVLS